MVSDKFPTHKKYQVIYTDPPWMYRNGGESISNQCSKHYPCMSVEDMSKIPVRTIADNDCALFMWTTNPQFPKALELIQKWGFEYKTIFKVWRKTNNDGSAVCVPGWWSRSSTEMLLVASKGSPLKKWKTTNSEPQEFASVRGEHSEKPNELRESVYNFLNVDNRIEIFARHIKSDWDSWGYDIPGGFHEGTGVSPMVVMEDKRTIGTQCDENVSKSMNKMKSTNTTKSRGGGILSHKPDCKCCCCVNKRKRNESMSSSHGDEHKIDAKLTSTIN